MADDSTKVLVSFLFSPDIQIPDVRRALLRPDDVLVLECSLHLDDGARAAIKASVARVFGADQKVLLVDAGTTVSILASGPR